MRILTSADRLLRQLLHTPLLLPSMDKQLEDLKILAALPLVKQIRTNGALESIHDAEFKVFSQFGDDGIIQYLISQIEISDAEQKFIEFGVENYKESNTRFLMINDNWSGLVIDGSQENIGSIKSDPIYWKHELTAVHSFVDRDNINNIFSANGFTGEIGLLSIDIDGNDYWIWEAIEVVNPAIVAIEYNAIFDSRRAVAVPYDPTFNCTRAHHSNLFWGSSLKALCLLAERKGYAFVGADSHGNNAYFVSRNRLGNIKPVSVEDGYVSSKFRESRGEAGQLTYASGGKRLEIIKDMSVFDFEKGAMVRLGELVA